MPKCAAPVEIRSEGGATEPCGKPAEYVTSRHGYRRPLCKLHASFAAYWDRRAAETEAEVAFDRAISTLRDRPWFRQFVLAATAETGQWWAWEQCTAKGDHLGAALVSMAVLTTIGDPRLLYIAWSTWTARLRRALKRFEVPPP